MNQSGGILERASALLELPLAVLSFAFFKIVRFLIGRLLKVYYFLANARAVQWNFASPELFAKPGVLPMIMTTGPRWNTHAIIGTVGPLAVKRSLAMNVASAESSARVWTLVINAFPEYRPIASISSHSAPFAGPWAEVPLDPGTYSVALRYYHWGEGVELPALTVDGVEVVHSASVPANLNDIYFDLAKRSNLFYVCLHYYVFVLLSYRRYFPAAFVEKEFLPSGNPETQFHFGAVRKGERVRMQVDASLGAYDVYLTMYNLASFPVASFQVTGREFVSPEGSARGTYLVRIHRNRPAQGNFQRDGIRISVIGPDGKQT